MKASVAAYTDDEQKLREFVTLKRAEYALQQRIERQRWEQRELVVAAEEYKLALQRGDADVLVLEANR